MNLKLDNLRVFDSHCHPQFPQYDSDREEMIARSKAEGIGMIAVGTDLETSKKAIELANKYENIWATVGLHPTDVSSVEYLVSSIGEFKELLNKNKVVAIGEIGLDYYRTPESEKQAQQKEVFKKFLDLAIQYNKAIILHARDAGKGSMGKVHVDVLEILNTRYLIQNTSPRGIAHSFTGTTEEAKKYLDLGFYLGFNGIITFTRDYDEMIRSVPLECILIETDAPFLAPETYRGQRNEPIYVVEIAKKLAEIKGISLEEVVRQTTLNTKELLF